MLNIVYGVSGSGKTAYLMDQIKNDIKNKKRCFLLVPEQQAYISEFDVPRMLPPNARLYFEVVHFSGLAEKIFHKYGGTTGESLSQGMRKLLMWETLRSSAPLLKEYKSNAAKDASLTALLMQTVNELRMNGVLPEDLENAAKQLPDQDSLKNKLFDIALLDSIYTDKLESCMGSDLPDRLLRMSKKLEENPFFSNCNVYVDSFTSFTMQEYRVLRQILQQADQVTVALPFDCFSSKLPHFATPTETAIRLLHMASDLNIPTKKHELLPKNTEKSRVLSVLERDLWRFDLHKNDREKFSAEDQANVKMLCCSNLYEESEAAALHIMELVQNGMLYGNIAVVVRDTETYRGVLDAAFERYSIPFFMSERTDLTSKPLSRLILSALRAIGRHYAAQDILTLVKTGLVGVDFSDASMFEEYCETWHIHGSRFLDDVWSMNADGLTTQKSARGEAILNAANRARKTVMEPLLRLSQAMKQSNLVPDRCRALYQYLCDLSISEQLAERAKKELSSGQRRQASETLRLYQFVIDVLCTLSTAFSNTEMTQDEFLMALNLLFAESDLGSVPNTHDCVIVGSANTLRVENIHAGLILGLCEGEFPLSVNDSGVFSERDKKLLDEKFGISLDSRERIRSSEELLYVYRAVTKPKKSLFLSTVSMQPDGSARTPSLAFSRIAYLLDRKKIEHFDLSRVNAILGKEKNTFDESHWRLAKNNEPITLHLSHTKLQSFLECPYKYYSSYLLKVRQQKDSRPSYSDDGLFLHYVFESFLKESLDENGKLHVPPADQIEPIADCIIERYLSEVCPIDAAHADKHLLHLFARLRRLALIILQNILEELKESKFVPTRFEQEIGKKGENSICAPTWCLNDGSRVVLSGKIDRVDLYDDGDSLYLRVVDYKSGKHDFKLEKVQSGLDIQLVLYLFAALSAEAKALPAGALYLYAENADNKLKIRRSGFYSTESSLSDAWELEKGTYTKGLTSQSINEVKALEATMQAAVTNAAERILAGEAQKTPSETACRFCPVRTSCDKVYHE